MTPPPIRPSLPLLILGGLLLLGGLAATGHARSRPAKGIPLAFEFNHEAYRDRQRQRDWPRWVTVMLTVRNPAKRRPLFMYGRNESGTLTLSFDDMGGLADGFEVRADGDAVIRVNQYSATRALDVDDYSAADWVRADPMPEVRVVITALEGFADQNQGMKALLDPNRKSDARSRDQRRAVYAATMRGEIRVHEARAPFEVPVQVTLGERVDHYTLTLEATMAVKGADLGLTGGDAGETLSLRLLTTAFAAFPQTQRAPTIDSLDMDMDLGLD